jgi:hypothetical protein
VLTDQVVTLTAVVVRRAEVIQVGAEGVRGVLGTDPALKELVLRALLLRRSRLLDLATEMRIVGRAGDPARRRLRGWAVDRGITHTVVDLDEDAGSGALLADLGVTEEDLPVVIWRGRQVLRGPTDDQLDAVVRGRRRGTGSQTIDAAARAADGTSPSPIPGCGGSTSREEGRPPWACGPGCARGTRRCAVERAPAALGQPGQTGAAVVVRAGTDGHVAYLVLEDRREFTCRWCSGSADACMPGRLVVISPPASRWQHASTSPPRLDR